MRSVKSCFCVTAWHLNREFYSAISLPEVDIYVISHQPRTTVPSEFFQWIPESNWYFEANVGYDWGCYEQFLEKKIWEDYSYIFFLHDDLHLISHDFIPHAIELLEDGAIFIGNGINSTHTQWPRTHLERYAHSSWVPPSIDFEHGSVRGSFIATTRNALRRLSRFEVFWDPHHVHTRLGNHSQTATCGKIQELFGEQSFAFLGSEYRKSKYLIEEERGSRESRLAITLPGWIITRIYKAIGTNCVQHRMQRIPNERSSTRNRFLESILSIVDGVRRNS